MKSTKIIKTNVYANNVAILENAKLNNQEKTTYLAQLDGLRKQINKNVKNYYEENNLFMGSKTLANDARYEVFNRDAIFTLENGKVIDIVAIVRTRDDRRIKQGKKARYDDFYAIDLKTLKVKKHLKSTK